MKKNMLLLLAMVLLSGCIGVTGWAKKDGTPIEPVQLEKDVDKCNRGWEICMVVDILFTAGVVSLIHNAQAHRCMIYKGYVKAKQKEGIQEKPITSASTPTIPSLGTTMIFTWDFSVAKAGPGDDYPVIATFRKNDKLTIMEQSGKWVKVRSENNQVGWIRSEVFE